MACPNVPRGIAGLPNSPTQESGLSTVDSQTPGRTRSGRQPEWGEVFDPLGSSARRGPLDLQPIKRRRHTERHPGGGPSRSPQESGVESQDSELRTRACQIYRQYGTYSGTGTSSITTCGPWQHIRPFDGIYQGSKRLPPFHAEGQSSIVLFSLPAQAPWPRRRLMIAAGRVWPCVFGP